MIDIKSQFPLFSSALNEDISIHATTINVKSGELLMRPGQYIKNTVLLISGKIKVYREDTDGGEFFLYYIQPGQACAISMICALKSEKSQIIAKVIEDVELLSIPLHLMDKWMMEHRSWYEFVIDTYRSRFEEVLSLVDNIAFRAMDERLEFYLKKQRESCGCNDLNLSHQVIANDLNTSREVISRLLKKMEQSGRIHLNRNHINFID